jgi:hypothetical protein
MVLLSFTGCTGTGSGGAADFTASATNEEVAAVESSLLLDRVMASEAIVADSEEILAATQNAEGMLRYRNRMYLAENKGSGFGLQRGSGSCMAIVGTASISVGAEQATIERLENGAIRITRGNGSVIETPAPIAGEISSFEIDNIEWEVTFGSDATEPLAILKNTRSGMILNISEEDDGTITMVRDSSEVFSGRWLEDGSLGLSDTHGKQHRYRYGKNL